MSDNAGPSSYAQDDDDDINNSPHVIRAREEAEKEERRYLEAHSEEMDNGTDGDRRRIRLHAKKAGNEKYEEELQRAIEETEAEKQQIKELLEACQAESERMREELRSMGYSTDQ